jgi:hypothetical protein
MGSAIESLKPDLKSWFSPRLPTFAKATAGRLATGYCTAGAVCA